MLGITLEIIVAFLVAFWASAEQWPPVADRVVASAVKALDAQNVKRAFRCLEAITTVSFSE